jgi:hypothetical protein
VVSSAGRTNWFHRNQIRTALRYRECTVADAEAVTATPAFGDRRGERAADTTGGAGMLDQARSMR